MPRALIERYELSDGLEKSASASSAVNIAEGIMQRIYEEDPSYWPYGLHVRGHKSLYLIKDAATHQYVGFVGWQESHDGFPRRTIGSYSIGVLPEYRGQGFAKEAVAKILEMNKDNVDEIRCYVMPHNRRSKGLANSLHVKTYEKF